MRDKLIECKLPVVLELVLRTQTLYWVHESFNVFNEDIVACDQNLFLYFLTVYLSLISGGIPTDITCIILWGLCGWWIKGALMLDLGLLKRNLSSYTCSRGSFLIVDLRFHSLLAWRLLRLYWLVSVVHRVAVCLLCFLLLTCSSLGALGSIRRISIFVLLVRARRDINLVSEFHVCDRLGLNTPHYFIGVENLIY